MGKFTGNTIGFLGRLRKDVRGNVIAMVAAGIFPLMGLVGGAVDMGRLYAVKTRLQSACDAGALAGRRVMGAGRWADNSNRANTVALSTFDLNFKEGSFGSENRTRAFVETDGTVNGTATANVPMTLMRVFNMPVKTLTVTCEGMMRIPNTDVMFVLDNSGSMDEVIPGDTTGLKKMAGLKRAIRCFYEALAKENIEDVSPADCGTTADPTAGLSSQVQLRFGFVNYDNMVNVGKLLPHDFMVNSWTYQSREANIETVQTWTLGTATTPDWGGWSATPDGYSSTAAYNSFAYLNNSVTLTDGVSYPKQKTTASNDAQCSALNTYGSYDEMIGVTETNGSNGTISYTATNNDPPTYPAPTQGQNASQNRTQTVNYGYRYRYFKNGSTWGCWLERASAKNSSNANKYTQTRTGPASKPIIWTPYDRIASWTYKPVTFNNLSDLKGSNGSWNSTVALPIGRTTVTNKKLSGSNVAVSLDLLANTNVTWNGCIEERRTYKNVDGDPSDDWTGYPSSPADAFDMDIDRVPSAGDPDTQWRPILHSAVITRKDTLTGSTWSGNWTTDPVTGGYASSAVSIANNASCVTPSRKLAMYDGRVDTVTGLPHQTAADFSAYVGSIVKHYNTYHDIGLLWGARLMSPTGIFASENATTQGGAQITRHLIFMTDGATANDQDNYASYGLEWWDRRQIDPTGLDASTYEAKLVANNNARSNALCTAIKNKNITLWVIYYGNSDPATKTRLTNCATSSTYFFEATSTPLLIAKFQEIADRISNLRLTN